MAGPTRNPQVGKEYPNERPGTLDSALI